MELQLSAGQGLFAESNFYARYDPPRFRRLAERYRHRLVQVYCAASDETIVSRYRTRGASGSRHPAHFDGANVERLRQGLADGILETLDMPGTLITVDTSSIEAVKLVYLVAEIEAVIYRRR